jgi:predicted DNA-binding protein
MPGEHMPVSIRLGKDLEERLTKASRKLRVNKTQVIKRSLEAYLAQIESGRTVHELGEGLFGADEHRGADRSSTFKSRLKRRLRAKYHHR